MKLSSLQYHYSNASVPWHCCLCDINDIQPVKVFHAGNSEKLTSGDEAQPGATPNNGQLKQTESSYINKHSPYYNKVLQLTQ